VYIATSQSTDSQRILRTNILERYARSYNILDTLSKLEGDRLVDIGALKDTRRAWRATFSEESHLRRYQP